VDNLKDNGKRIHREVLLIEKSIEISVLQPDPSNEFYIFDYVSQHFSYCYTNPLVKPDNIFMYSEFYIASGVIHKRFNICPGMDICFLENYPFFRNKKSKFVDSTTF
jgi:hypothetical protein